MGRFRLLGIVAAAACGAPGGARVALPAGPAPTAPVAAAQVDGGAVGSDVLSWLPVDTVSATVARGPFPMPPPRPDTPDLAPGPMPSARTAVLFQSLALGLFGLSNGGLAPKLAGRRVMIALTGVARFRSPKGLGEGPFDGCSVAVFADSVRDPSFIAAALSRREVAGVSAAELGEKLEQEVWHTYVAFPTDRVAMVCTDTTYMAALIERSRAGAERARFAEGALQWEHVDEQATYWGIHVDREHGGGCTFAVRANASNRLTIDYFGADAEALAPKLATEAKGFEISRARTRGVLEGTYALDAPAESVSLGLFYLEALLGHVIFV